MTFWFRHILLIVVCIVLPFVAALYVDTDSEVARTQRAGETAAKLGSQGLRLTLTLDAHSSVSNAISLAQQLADATSAGQPRGGKRFANRAEIARVLDQAGGIGGFAWLVDEEGVVVARNGRVDEEPNPRRIDGHPLFISSQRGLAIDGLFADAGKTYLVAAAPLVDEGHAAGCVVMGKPVDNAFVSSIASSLDAQITLSVEGKVVASTLDPELAQSLVGGVGESTAPVLGGRLAKSLEHPRASFLPLWVDHYATGSAYTSIGSRAPGLVPAQWVVSVESGANLRDLGARQEIVLGGLAIALMLGLLAGLVNHRTFVHPIAVLCEHLSELQLGRGEVELAERRVSLPFRRLVRLVNMAMQKLPARGLSPIAPPSSKSQSSEILSSTGSVPLMRNEPAFLSSTPSSAMPSTEPDVEARRAAQLAPKPTSQAAPNLASEPAPLLPDSARPLPPFQFGVAEPVAAPSRDARPRAKEEDTSRAIAEAIAVLEAQSVALEGVGLAALPPITPTTDLEDPNRSRAPRKSAGDIRGRPMIGTPEPASPFIPTLPSRGGATSMRAGGSLDAPGQGLSQAAALQQSWDLGSADIDSSGMGHEETVVAPVASELLAKSARDDFTETHSVPNMPFAQGTRRDTTVVGSVPPDLLAQSMVGTREAGAHDGGSAIDAADHAHFKEVYERFIELRKKCGESTSDLGFDRFLAKLTKNREGLMQKYNCRTVRFQVYEKDGKAALKATPVRGR